MSLHGISAAATRPHVSPAERFSLAGEADFGDKLQLGQMLKARVLRHYEGNRYAVDFDGHEKVVDSALPLETGEVLYGRVVGVGERVMLERVRVPSRMPGNDNTPGAQAQPVASADKAAQLVADLFAQFRAQLAPAQALLMTQSVRDAADRPLMGMAGLLLNKLGIGLSPEWLKSVYELLRTEPQRGTFPLTGDVPVLEVTRAGLDGTQNGLRQSANAILAELLKQCMEQSLAHDREEDVPVRQSRPTTDAHTSAPEMRREDSRHARTSDPMRRLMNVQSGGSVAHRINTVPLLVNGRLLELNIAVFEQRDGQHTKDETRHRQVSFSLHCEQLGHVEVRGFVTGEHLKLTLSTDRETAAEHLAAYSPQLREQLLDDGWLVDELHYEISEPEAAGVARAVMQHLIRQDSVSRLL